MDRGRLEAFSDGVFAVAITLLALDLVIAGPGHGPLAHQLEQRWPGFVAYVISFFTIGVIWINHHTLVSNIRVVSRSLLYLNLVMLLFVVLVPFATGTVAGYLRHDDFDARVAVAVYSGTLLGMSLGFAGMLEWSLRPGRTFATVPAGRHWLARLRFASGGLVYLAVIGIAFLNAQVALAIIAVVAVYYMSERTPALTDPRHELSGPGPATDEPG